MFLIFKSKIGMYFDFTLKFSLLRYYILRFILNLKKNFSKEIMKATTK